MGDGPWALGAGVQGLALPGGWSQRRLDRPHRLRHVRPSRIHPAGAALLAVVHMGGSHGTPSPGAKGTPTRRWNKKGTLAPAHVAASPGRRARPIGWTDDGRGGCAALRCATLAPGYGLACSSSRKTSRFWMVPSQRQGFSNSRLHRPCVAGIKKQPQTTPTGLFLGTGSDCAVGGLLARALVRAIGNWMRTIGTGCELRPGGRSAVNGRVDVVPTRPTIDAPLQSQPGAPGRTTHCSSQSATPVASTSSIRPSNSSIRPA